MWQTVERKAKFIEQVMHGDLENRSAEDLETSASFNMNEIKAVSSDNPLILEKAQADQDLSVLESLETAHRRSQTQMRQALESANASIASYTQRVPALEQALAQRVETRGEKFRATVNGRVFTERVEAATAMREPVVEAAAQARASREPVMLPGLVAMGGHTFDVTVDSRLGSTKATVQMQGAPHDVFVRDDVHTLMGLEGSHGVITRVENSLTSMEGALNRCAAQIRAVEPQRLRP